MVDDHPRFRREMVALIDGMNGFSVTIEAAHGKDLVLQLGSGRLPDLVLLDICMPVMDGIETASWLTRHYPQLKILILSSECDPVVIWRLLECGVRGFVLKNTEPDELRVALETLIADGTYFTFSFQELVRRFQQGGNPPSV